MKWRNNEVCLYNRPEAEVTHEDKYETAINGRIYRLTWELSLLEAIK